MESKISMYFTPVDGCDNELCQFHKSCGFRDKKVHHMDVNLLNDILRDCFLHINSIERIYFAVRGNSQIYKSARDIDLGGFSSRCVMSYTYPYTRYGFPRKLFNDHSSYFWHFLSPIFQPRLFVVSVVSLTLMRLPQVESLLL